MKDKEKLSGLLNKNPAYRNMDQKAIRVIEAVANTKIQVNEKEEKGNVCEGLQGIIDDAIQEEKSHFSPSLMAYESYIFRNSVGVHIFSCLNIRRNADRLEKPHCSATSSTGRFGSSSRVLA